MMGLLIWLLLVVGMACTAYLVVEKPLHKFTCIELDPPRVLIESPWGAEHAVFEGHNWVSLERQELLTRDFAWRCDCAVKVRSTLLKYEALRAENIQKTKEQES